MTARPEGKNDADVARRRKIILNIYFFLGVALAAGVLWLVGRSMHAAALATPPALKPWVYMGGIGTMWLAFAAIQGFKRLGFFAGDGRREQTIQVVLYLTAFIAIAAGFGAAILNIPEIDSGLKLLLAMAAVASGGLAGRLLLL